MNNSPNTYYMIMALEHNTKYVVDHNKFDGDQIKAKKFNTYDEASEWAQINLFGEKVLILSPMSDEDIQTLFDKYKA